MGPSRETWSNLNLTNTRPIVQFQNGLIGTGLLFELIFFGELIFGRWGFRIGEKFALHNWYLRFTIGRYIVLITIPDILPISV